MLLLATKVWEQRKLGEIGKTYSGLSGKNKSDFEKGNSNFVTFLEVLNNPVLKNIDLTNKVEIKENEHQNKVKRNDILFNTSSETPEEVATSTVVDVNQNNLYLNSFCFGFRPNVQFSNYYIGYYLRSNHFRSRVFCLAQGISRYNISKKSLIKLKLSLPKLEEQDKISRIFNQIELLLTLYERKLKLLSQVKKYFLDNLFTEKEYPNLRFKGFTDAWEQRKLGQVGKTQSGVGFPNEEQGGLEGIPFFKVSDMNNPGNEYEMVNANNYVKDDQLARKKWHPIKSVPAVIFAKVGAAIMLNRKRLVTRPFLIDNNSMAYIFDDSWDINFGKNIFETINLPRYAQVGALPSYNGSDIQGIKIFLPRKNEQSKIGIFIMTINEIITLYENKQQHLTKIKKTLLNTMFI